MSADALKQFLGRVLTKSLYSCGVIDGFTSYDEFFQYNMNHVDSLTQDDVHFLHQLSLRVCEPRDRRMVCVEEYVSPVSVFCFSHTGRLMLFAGKYFPREEQ